MKYFVTLYLLFWGCELLGGITFHEPVLEAHLGLNDQVIVRDFSFTNTGDQSVTISQADAGCSCLSVEIAKGKFTYAPGEKGIMRAKFEVGNLQGIVEKDILIWLKGDLPEQASSKVSLKLHIPTPFVVEPKTVKWKKSDPSEMKLIDVKIDSDMELRIKTVSVSSSAFSAKLLTVEEAKHYQIQITPKNTEIPSLGVILITTDAKNDKFKSLQGFAIVSNS